MSLSDFSRAKEARERRERLKESRERRERARLAAALAKGFSSYEELSKHRIMKEEKHYEELAKRVEEETGMTLEEYWENQERSRSDLSSKCGYNQCDCQDHPIPMFCSKSLVDYKSQDQPGLVGYFQAKGDQELRNLTIDLNNKSNRLSQDILERHWEWCMEGLPSEWPPWLKGDSVLRRIEKQGEQDESKRVLEFFEAYLKDKAERGSPWSTSTEDRSDMEMSEITRPSTPTSLPSIEEAQSIKANIEPEINQCRAFTPLIQYREPGDVQTAPQKPMPQLKITNTSQSRFARPSRVSKNKRLGRRQRGKVVETTRRTRSQNVTKFYKLENDGTATTYRSYR